MKSSGGCRAPKEAEVPPPHVATRSVAWMELAVRDQVLTVSMRLVCPAGVMGVQVDGGGHPTGAGLASSAGTGNECWLGGGSPMEPAWSARSGGRPKSGPADGSKAGPESGEGVGHRTGVGGGPKTGAESAGWSRTGPDI